MEPTSPNCKCNVCKTDIYRRPSELLNGKVYCGLKCAGISLRKKKLCVVCSIDITARKNRITCSDECESARRRSARIRLPQKPPKERAGKLNVNHKGTIGLSLAIAEFVKNGYEVFTPFCDYSPVDIVVANDAMQLQRIQIKYREARDGRLTIQFCTVVNGKHTPINFDLIDGWAIYCPDIGRVLFLPKHLVDTTLSQVTIRIDAPPQTNRCFSLNAADLMNASAYWTDVVPKERMGFEPMDAVKHLWFSGPVPSAISVTSPGG